MQWGMCLASLMIWEPGTLRTWQREQTRHVMLGLVVISGNQPKFEVRGVTYIAGMMEKLTPGRATGMLSARKTTRVSTTQDNAAVSSIFRVPILDMLGAGRTPLCHIRRPVQWH